MLKDIQLFCIASCLAMTACSTVTDKIPTVKIERKKPKVIQTTQANYTAPKVHKAEAALVCENENMRARSADKNLKNDTARVLVLEEGGRSSNIIADVEVNCRDYFQSTRYTNARQNTIAPLSPPQAVYGTQQSITATSDSFPARQNVINTKAAPQSTTQNNVIKSSSSNVQAADGYYYSVKKGDTLYRIARENCSTVNDISTLNGISDPTKIEIHQIIRLPAKKCNARN